MKKNNRIKETLGFYWSETKKYKVAVSLLVFAVVLNMVAGLIVPLFYKKLFNLLASSNLIPARAELLTSLLAIVWWVAFLYGVQWVALRIANQTLARFEAGAMAGLSNFCFARLHLHSFSFFNNNFTGTLTKKMKWFTGAFEALTDRLIWDIIPFVVSAVVIVVVLAFTSIWLAISLVVWMVVFLTVNGFFAVYKLKYDALRNEAESENSGLLSDGIVNNANIKLFTGYQNEIESFSSSTNKVKKARLFTWNLENYFGAAQDLLASALEIFIIYLAVRLWVKGLITVGDFALIQAYLITLFYKIWGLGNVMRRIFQSLSDAEEMTEILLTPPEIQDIPGAKKLKVKAGEIAFENVVFRYGHQGRTVLNQLSLQIRSGEKVAFIGPSGAGKTTVIKLLLRMHDLTSGKILIDGRDISQVTQESLWQNVSLVPQDPVLFHRTLKENIRYGRPEATDKQVIEAAKKARCHDFIIKQEKGYDTFVGERGIKLSGGERQRVAIARAILRNAPILVLDEATSSLDSESEHLIQEALNELMEGKTVLVIAHRLSTIRHVDRIVVVDEGRVVEEGTHDELANQTGGIYAKLWQLQAGGFVK